MKAPLAWLLCLLLLLLLLGLVLPGSTSRSRQHSMETRTPDINPAWYTGRGIRPVGRFGRRRAALGESRPAPPGPPACVAPLGSARTARDRPRFGSWRK